MIIVDTHAWIWLATAPKKLGRRARGVLGRAQRIGVPSIACLEVAMLVERGRLTLDRELTEWLHQALALPAVEVVAISPEIAVRASQLVSLLPGDPADRLIAATAQLHAATLVTKDRRLRAAPGLTTIW